MIVGLALLVGLLIASALGANLTRLADLKFRGSVLVFGALAIQAGIFTPLRDNVPAGWDRPLHVLSYVMILGFFAANVRVPAFWLVGFGLIGNVCVIFANGGPVYSSSNPPFAGGPIRLGDTISDVISQGDASSPAHRLMPAFMWTGDQSIERTRAELFRIYVFTDSQCLNRVYASAVVDGPAYAPRPVGPLALPAEPASMRAARADITDGTEPDGDNDGPTVHRTGADLASHADDPRADRVRRARTRPLHPPPAHSRATPGAASSAPRSTCGTPTGRERLLLDGHPGLDVAGTPGALKTQHRARRRHRIDRPVTVASAVGFSSGRVGHDRRAPEHRNGDVTAISRSLLTISLDPRVRPHIGGRRSPITNSSGISVYQDIELPQDACAAPYDRVSALRQEERAHAHHPRGEPVRDSGLSTEGRLAARPPNAAAFYGAPARRLDARARRDVYEVQWSKTANPFKPGAEPAELRSARDDGGRHIDESCRPHARHLVLPRPRLRLRAADRRAGDVVVRPRQDRRRETQVSRYRAIAPGRKLRFRPAVESPAARVNVRGRSPRTPIRVLARRLFPTVRPRALTRPRPHQVASG